MRITYWTTCCLEPEIEAISKEVFELAKHFESYIFSIHHENIFRYQRHKYVGFHPKFDLFLRIFISYLEKFTDINHVYGEPTPWTYYKSLKKRPIVLTVASEKGIIKKDFLQRCSKIIVQTEEFHKKLLTLGIPENQIEIIYPSIDATIFSPKNPKLMGKPKILFATAPRTKEEMAARGVNLLLQTATKNTHYQYHFLYRQWRTGYTSLEETKKEIRSLAISNIVITNTIESDMASIYNKHDFIIIPYTTPKGGKECPNSVIEAMACGLPVLISKCCPFADFIEKHQCGIVFHPNSESIIESIEIACKRYDDLSRKARQCAVDYFDYPKMLEKMQKIYNAS